MNAGTMTTSVTVTLIQLLLEMQKETVFPLKHIVHIMTYDWKLSFPNLILCP